jgi:hypothetical protein
MIGLRSFIHHPNGDNISAPDTGAVLGALDAAMEAEEPSIISVLGKVGTGKSRLVQYWAIEYRRDVRGIDIERAPVILAEVDETEKATLGKGVYTTATACVTFSSIMYGLAELAQRIEGSHTSTRWYREERSLYTDRQFVWLFDQVCLEIRRLRVRAVVVDNAHRLEPKTMRVLQRLRTRLNNRIALVFAAQLAKNEGIDEPLGKVFERAKVDPSDCELPIEIKPLTEQIFYDSVLETMFADLDAAYEKGLEDHVAFIGEALWKNTAGDWHNINSRVKHFNRLLGPRGSDSRVITRSIVEQVIGHKLPT